MRFSIRPAAPADIPAIREVLVETWHATYDPIFGAEKVTDITNRWHSLENLDRQRVQADQTRESHAFLVGEQAGRIVGTISVNRDGATPDLLHLARLYILPDAQGAGLGRALLKATLARLPAARRIDLEVELANAGAIGFYRRLGFAEVAHGTACGSEAAAAVRHLVMAAPLPLLDLRPARDSDAQDLFGLIALCFAEYPGCFVDPHDDLPDLLRPGHWGERRGLSGALLGGAFLVLEDGSGRVSACVAVDFPETPAAAERESGTPAGRAPSPKVAELHRLYVRPDARRGGIATALVARVEAIARFGGAGRIILWSDTRFTNAHRLYGRLGYTGGTIVRPFGDISNSLEFFFEKSL